ALVPLVLLATSVPEKLVHAGSDAGTDAGSDASTDAAKEAAAPLPEGGAEHYTLGQGTVFDNRTRLTWQHDVPMDPVSWADARDYCAKLDLGGTGWRLPSVSELQTLIDETKTDPAIDLTAFSGTPVDYFWTSSALPRFDNFAWSVYFGYGLSTF